MFENISVEEYAALADELDAETTIFVGGRWPVSVGRHPDLGEILLGHVGDQAMLAIPPPMAASDLSVPNLTTASDR